MAQTNANDVIAAMMGFDPTNVEPFNKSEQTHSVDNDIYKTDPDETKSTEDDHYHSKIRILYNPFNPGRSVVTQSTWAIKDTNGNFRLVNAIPKGEGARQNCPLSKASSKVFVADAEFARLFALKKFPGAEMASKRAQLLEEFNSVPGRGKEAWAQKFKGTQLGQMILDYGKETFDNNEAQYVLVQILEDENKPELVGQIKVMKLPKVLASRMEAKQKAKVDVKSWVLGYPVLMDVAPGPDDKDHPERRNRERSYDACEFADEFEPIIKTDGTPLFDESQVDVLDEFFKARKESLTAKTEKKREAAAALIAPGTDLYTKVAELTQVAYNYLVNEANIINLVDKMAYKPWDAETAKVVQNWIDEVTLVKFAQVADAPTDNDAAHNDAAPMAEQAEEKPKDVGDDLPF